MVKGTKLPLTGSTFHFTAFFFYICINIQLHVSILILNVAHIGAFQQRAVFPRYYPLRTRPLLLLLFSLHHASSMLLVSGSGSGNIGVFLESLDKFDILEPEVRIPKKADGKLPKVYTYSVL